MDERERTTLILSQGIVFWLAILLPWYQLFGEAMANSITYGWLAAGFLWIGAGLVRTELLHA